MNILVSVATWQFNDVLNKSNIIVVGGFLIHIAKNINGNVHEDHLTIPYVTKGAWHLNNAGFAIR